MITLSVIILSGSCCTISRLCVHFGTTQISHSYKILSCGYLGLGLFGSIGWHKLKDKTVSDHIKHLPLHFSNTVNAS